MATKELPDRFGDAEILRSPYDYYSQIRGEDEIFFSKALNAFVISRFADSEAVLQNTNIFVNTPPINQSSAMAAYTERYYKLYDEANVPRRVPVLAMTDGSLHLRYRELINPRFMPSAIKRMEDALAAVVDGLIDGFIERGAEGEGSVDLYREYALLVPLYFFCDTLGVPRTHIQLMQDAGAASIALVTGGLLDEEGRVAAHLKLIEFAKFIQENIQRLRAGPDDSLLSHMIHSETRDGDRLSEQEVISMCATLNTGGNETTTNGLGNTLYAAIKDPQTLQRLAENRDLIPKFIEEVMRFDSPIAAATRWAKEDTVIGETLIPKGSCVHVRLASGNRDEAKYNHANEFDPQRGNVRNHLGFGHGVHYCVGVHLSRSEIRIGLARLLDRLEDMRIDASKGPIEYAEAGMVHGLKALPITFRKRRD
ncbi:cytochrome P450 [Rhizorhapis suberifaciens]|uniref:Cytochrome P450 n=1 Tax=Rhizorhapis suberifaciens TaxID=13656 RepID=A0A840HXT5_9SPHN|nr:cytochrome P450 [Rhizorhapis suberifaciens]MBB4642204.1 cytochrome P450 [Rhizorhapis suberifaciens]